MSGKIVVMRNDGGVNMFPVENVAAMFLSPRGFVEIHLVDDTTYSVKAENPEAVKMSMMNAGYEVIMVKEAEIKTNENNNEAVED